MLKMLLPMRLPTARSCSRRNAARHAELLGELDADRDRLPTCRADDQERVEQTERKKKEPVHSADDPVRGQQQEKGCGTDEHRKIEADHSRLQHNGSDERDQAEDEQAPPTTVSRPSKKIQNGAMCPPTRTLRPSLGLLVMEN